MYVQDGTVLDNTVGPLCAGVVYVCMYVCVFFLHVCVSIGVLMRGLFVCVP